MANWDPKLSIHLEEAGKIDYEECFLLSRNNNNNIY